MRKSKREYIYLRNNFILVILISNFKLEKMNNEIINIKTMLTIKSPKEGIHSEKA
jgi:hypothetical protein